MNQLNCGLLCRCATLCAVLFAGCAGGSKLGTEPVQGVVTLDGTPVAEATVMFSPVAPGQGLSATGMTDAQGVYRLSAISKAGAIAQVGAGTLPGEYYVGVIKSISEVPMTQQESLEKNIPYVAPQPGQAPKVTDVVPVKYNSPEKSGIKVTVKAGKNDIPIELSSK